MSVQGNKETVRGMINILNARDLSRLDEVCDENMVYRIGSEDGYQGLATYKELSQKMYEAFPDVELSIEQIMAEGDRVHMIYVITGTHEGEYLSIPPSHRKMVHPASSILALKNGKVVEQRDFYDMLHFLKQLGAVSDEVRPDGKEWPAGGAKLRPQ
jgi:steroid delta-isomerase-like uncharacterized protein